MLTEEHFKPILLSQIAHKAFVGGKRWFHFRPCPTKRAGKCFSVYPDWQCWTLSFRTSNRKILYVVRKATVSFCTCISESRCLFFLAKVKVKVMALMLYSISVCVCLYVCVPNFWLVFLVNLGYFLGSIPRLWNPSLNLASLWLGFVSEALWSSLKNHFLCILHTALC